MEKQTLAHDVYRDLRQAIIACELLPGEPLYEAALSKRLNVSRTPIREALRRLEHEGLVETEPHRGARVAQVLRQDVLQAFEVREWIEPAMFAKAARSIDADTLALLRESVDAMPATPRTHAEAVAAIGADLRFHEIVAEYAGNRFVRALFVDLLAVTRRAIHFSPPGRFHHAHKEHQKILEALAAHQPKAAAELVRQHIANAYQRFTGGFTD